MLQRIGLIFETLTFGAYTRVTSETDGDSAARLVLLQRDFPDERQTVDQLSEGTRDQLFLALRVAEIERHLISAPRYRSSATTSCKPSMTSAPWQRCGC